MSERTEHFENRSFSKYVLYKQKLYTRILVILQNHKHFFRIVVYEMYLHKELYISFICQLRRVFSYFFFFITLFYYIIQSFRYDFRLVRLKCTICNRIVPRGM